METQESIIKDYTVNIGMKVTKGRSGAIPPKTKSVKSWKPKAFKSRSYVNTIKGVIDHPILHIPAFTFMEDDSYVECRRCRIVPEPIRQLKFTTTTTHSIFGGDNVSFVIDVSKYAGAIQSKLKGTGAYIHDDAEILAGFDIPTFLGGHMGQLDLPIGGTRYFNVIT